MNSCQHDFFKTIIHQLLGFSPNTGQLSGPQRPPGKGNYAIAAKIGTALLYFQKSPGTSRHFIQGNIFKLPGLHYIIHSINDTICSHCPFHIINYMGPVFGSQYYPHPFNGFHLLRSRLRIATRYGNNSFFVESAHPSDKLPGFFVTKAGNRAGIYNIYIRLFSGRHQLIALFFKQPFHGFSFKLIYLAAKRNKGHS